MSHLATRIVVPLFPEDAALKPISELNPTFEIKGKRHLMFTQTSASIPERDLKRPITILAEHDVAVTRALDTLLLGF